MSFWTDLVGGGNSMQFADPAQGETQAAIGQLSNSTFGADEAAQSEREVGRNLQQEDQSIDSNAGYGRNAAVSSALKDRAMESYGSAVGSANVKGAALDASNRAQGARLGLQEGSLENQINEGNYQRQQDQTFGHSFVGGLLHDAVGFAAGEGMQSLFGGGGKNKPVSDDSYPYIPARDNG